MLLPESDGESVDDRQRLGDVLPLADPVVVVDCDGDGVNVPEGHAEEVAVWDSESVPQRLAETLAVADTVDVSDSVADGV